MSKIWLSMPTESRLRVKPGRDFFTGVTAGFYFSMEIYTRVTYMSRENPNKADKAYDKEDAAKLEQFLRLRKLEAEAREVELRVKKAERDDTKALQRAESEAEFKLREAQAKAEIAEIQRDQVKRQEEINRSDASEHFTYMFYDIVNKESIKPCMIELDKWARRRPGMPVTIILNSPGGSVLDGLALYDQLRAMSAKGHKITVICRGMAASMGGILLQAGDRRIMGREAWLLIHEVSSGARGKYSEMKDDVDFTGELWKQLAEILSKRSKMTPDQIRRKAKYKDWWERGPKAVELGFADEIEAD